MIDAGWQTFLDIDRRLGRPKGSAFRIFKRMVPTLREGTDFAVLDANDPAPLLAQLKAEGRIYHSSIRVVLLAPETARNVAAMLATHYPTARRT